MADKRILIQGQIEAATRQLDQRKQQLQAKSWGEKDFKRDPKFREFKAGLASLNRRMKAVQGLVDLEAEVQRLKAERLALPRQQRVIKKKVPAATSARPGKGAAKAKGSGGGGAKKKAAEA